LNLPSPDTESANDTTPLNDTDFIVDTKSTVDTKFPNVTLSASDAGSVIGTTEIGTDIPDLVASYPLRIGLLQG
jgi:hypothetical protein